VHWGIGLEKVAGKKDREKSKEPGMNQKREEAA